MSKGKNLLKRLAAAVEQLRSGRSPDRWSPRDVARFWNVDYEFLIRIYQADGRTSWFAKEFERVEADPEYVTPNLERVIYPPNENQGRYPTSNQYRSSRWTWIPNNNNYFSRLMEELNSLPDGIPPAPNKEFEGANLLDYVLRQQPPDHISEAELEKAQAEHTIRRRIQNEINEVIESVYRDVPINPVLNSDPALRPSGADLGSRDAYRDWRRTIQTKQQELADRVIKQRMAEKQIPAVRVELDGRGLPRSINEITPANVEIVTKINQYLRNYSPGSSNYGSAPRKSSQYTVSSNPSGTPTWAKVEATTEERPSPAIQSTGRTKASRYAQEEIEEVFQKVDQRIRAAPSAVTETEMQKYMNIIQAGSYADFESSPTKVEKSDNVIAFDHIEPIEKKLTLTTSYEAAQTFRTKYEENQRKNKQKETWLGKIKTPKF